MYHPQRPAGPAHTIQQSGNYKQTPKLPSEIVYDWNRSVGSLERSYVKRETRILTPGSGLYFLLYMHYY